MGFLESFVKNVFCDVVKPRPGSVVKVDLLGGADHTGAAQIYGRLSHCRPQCQV